MLLALLLLAEASTPRFTNPLPRSPPPVLGRAPVQTMDKTAPRSAPALAELEDRSTQVRLEDLEVVERVDPGFPVSARGVDRYECVVRLYVDDDGEPVAVQPLACASPFFETAEDALMRWRFEPYKDGVPVKTDIAVDYTRPD